MKTEYRFIEFVEGQPKKKTRTWTCCNRRQKCAVGFVVWYAPWRRYAFHPAEETVFTEECLLDMIDFLKQADKDQEKRRAAQRTTSPNRSSEAE